LSTNDLFPVGYKVSHVKTFTNADVERFAQICGDYNPLHFEANYAAQTRFRHPIIHGMLTASLFSTLVGMYLPGTGAIYLGQDLKFLHPVYVGDTITASGEVRSYDPAKRLLLIDTTGHNQHQTLVITGQARVRYEPVINEPITTVSL
jgi:3-hydroxybutyryl-CoA dehydratase